LEAQKPVKQRTGITVFVIVVCGTLLLSSWLARQVSAVGRDAYQNIEAFANVLTMVQKNYVDEVGTDRLIDGAINGMLASLDPHSAYLTPDLYKELQVDTRGSFGGLGIEITQRNGVLTVVSPIEDTPAFRAGIKPNDLIIMLDGEQVQGLTLQEAVERMRGPINSQIKLTIRRGNAEPFEVSIARAVIRIQSVRHRTEGDLGYIRITSFTEQTEQGLRTAVTRIKEQLGPKLKGLVLDMRNNPGGLLDQAIAVSDAFLDKGEIVSTRGRRSEDAQRYNAKAGDLLTGLPMVVLVNGGSASASEIVAGALQDHRRAILLGTRSFGKGSVQTIIPLGGQGALRLTTARYYTPSGRSIQASGIDPDIVVEQSRIEKIDTPAQRREADLRGALRNPNAAPGAPTNPGPQPGQQPAPATADETAPDQPQDYQLTRAFDLLRGLTLFNQRVAN
jgi:carboxyl-terminal processing protease